MRVLRLPTKVDIEAFKRDGIILVKNVLTEAQVKSGRNAIDAAVLNPGPQAEFISPGSTWESVANSFQNVNDSEDKNGAKGDNKKPSWTMFQDQFASKRCPEMMDFIRQSPAPQLASIMLSASKSIDDDRSASNSISTAAALFYDHVIVKKPTPNDDPKTANVIPWHQDLPYWSVQGNIVSVWMCFDPMPKASAVQWICGSHKWGQFQPRHFVDSSPYEGTEDMTPMPDIDDMIASGKVSVKTFDAKPGDALIFDARIIHGSPGHFTASNGGPDEKEKTQCQQEQSQHRRVALRFASGDTIFCNWKNRETAIPTPDITHSLHHGDILSSDGTFPVLWPPNTTSGKDLEENA